MPVTEHSDVATSAMSCAHRALRVGLRLGAGKQVDRILLRLKSAFAAVAQSAWVSVHEHNLSCAVTVSAADINKSGGEPHMPQKISPAHLVGA